MDELIECRNKNRPYGVKAMDWLAGDEEGSCENRASLILHECSSSYT